MLRMICLASLVIVIASTTVFAQQAASTPATSASAKDGRLPLIIVECRDFQTHKLKNDSLSLAAIGRAAASYGYQSAARGQWSDESLQYAGHFVTALYGLIDDLVENKTALLTANKDASTLVAVFGPSCNSGEAFVPVAISRQGSTITLLADHWTDNGERLRNVPSTSAWVLSLGRLPAGQYEFRIQVRKMHRDMRKQAGYQWTELTEAAAAFNVSKSESPDESGPQNVPTLKLSDLKKADLPAEAKATSYQHPYAYSRRLASKAKVEPQLKAGSFALAKLLGAPQPTLDDLDAVPGAREATVDCAAIVCPVLNSGEWASVREVTWTPAEIVVHVEVWRDTMDRIKNIRWQPLLVVPLETFGNKGEYTIRVQWHPLTAPSTDGLYVPAKEEPVQPLAEKTKL